MSLSDFVSGLLSGGGVDSAEAGPDGRPGNPTGDSATVVYECRQCGTTVGSDSDRCPTCETATIAEYPVE